MLQLNSKHCTNTVVHDVFVTYTRMVRIATGYLTQRLPNKFWNSLLLLSFSPHIKWSLNVSDIGK